VKKRKFTKDDAVYGIFNDGSSSDDGGSNKSKRSDKKYAISSILYFSQSHFAHSPLTLISDMITVTPLSALIYPHVLHNSSCTHTFIILRILPIFTYSHFYFSLTRPVAFVSTGSLVQGDKKKEEDSEEDEDDVMRGYDAGVGLGAKKKKKKKPKNIEADLPVSFASSKSKKYDLFCLLNAC
jgi:hypothetical protein